MLSENIRMALSSIRAARFRSFLTMLGIIIGVISVITTVSLGNGIKHQIAGHANSVGKDLITVRPGNLVKRDGDGKITGINFLSFLSSASINEKDIETIRKNPKIETVVPFSVINGVPSLDGKRYDDGFIMATSDKMPEVTGYKVEFGNFFSDSDKDRKAAVVGYNVAEKLFEENVPIGKSFQIRGQEFIVSGVLERLPEDPLNPEADFNNGIFIPYSIGQSIVKTELNVYQAYVRPKDKSPDAINAAISSMSADLEKNHGGERDFTVLRQDEMTEVADNLLSIVTTTVSIMAAVALFVGGIGIMNVMLVSVTERTREIGIRKAVGATNQQIQSQFLIEAVVLSIWGAMVGVILSFLINIAFRIFTNLEPVITWEIVLISAGVSIIVGIVFGIVPAAKAARKDPIEALRTS